MIAEIVKDAICLRLVEKPPETHKEKTAQLFTAPLKSHAFRIKAGQKPRRFIYLLPRNLDINHAERLSPDAELSKEDIESSMFRRSVTDEKRTIRAGENDTSGSYVLCTEAILISEDSTQAFTAKVPDLIERQSNTRRIESFAEFLEAPFWPSILRKKPRRHLPLTGYRESQ
jgi:hypothetical protein